MSNFRINFSHPWLLLLLIPAVAFTLLSYFKLGKRYRCTRNRIVSMVLHLTVMLLAITILAGITFSYFKPNTENEVILLVDASYSTSEDSQDEIDDFIKAVIDNTDSKFKLGIVTFGYNQVYAAELSNDTDKLFSSYLESPTPDTTATDIASALTYASELFNKPETARIVLLSDAMETDLEAKNIIKSVAAKGIKVDTVHFPENDIEDEVQIIDMVKPEEKIYVGQKFSVNVTIESSYAGDVTLTPYDNEVQGEKIEVTLEKGINTVTVPYMFTLPGLHEMFFEIEGAYDTIAMNNSYLSYIYLEIFDDILIIESIDDESDNLTEMLKDENNVTVINSSDTEAVPKTVDALRAYDEVILCNVSNEDLPEGFDQILYTYVFEYGGGLFTVCGAEEGSTPGSDNWTANAYTREDMNKTLYQEMLPVEIIDYTPPAAVMIIIDTSGSMLNSENPATSKLGYAIQGAESCLNALTERDYVGVMTLADSYSEEIELTPRPQRDKILSAIGQLEEDALNGIIGGGTIFSAALERAGKVLSAMTEVEKKHIIIVTDGEPAQSDEEDYQFWFQENAKLGITTSIVGIECSSSAVRKMQDVLVDYAGMTKENFHDVKDVEDTPGVMYDDLNVKEIKETNYEQFDIKVNSTTSPIFNGVELRGFHIPVDDENNLTLDGFYGVKLKKEATVLLSGMYTPLYAEWQFGKGKVGTFACDLNGAWSSDFVNSEAGVKIISNIVKSLYPKESIKPMVIDAEWTGDNYTTQLSIFTDLGEGEYIEATITSPIAEGETDPRVQVLTANATDGYSRMVFGVTTPGLHEILVQKKSADGTVICEQIIYKPLSYSKEYDAFPDEQAAKDLIEYLAQASGGEVITDPVYVFQNAAKYIHIVIDPRIPFMILAIILFLLDIAARKFKWKWPHEIVKDKKARAAMSSK
ncbi:MAG: VWA domain-containing protein [Clostridia bacterium]|nr:VWA domain-containing protein [Clostridia bacterium]